MLCARLQRTPALQARDGCGQPTGQSDAGNQGGEAGAMNGVIFAPRQPELPPGIFRHALFLTETS